MLRKHSRVLRSEGCRSVHVEAEALKVDGDFQFLTGRIGGVWKHEVSHGEPRWRVTHEVEPVLAPRQLTSLFGLFSIKHHQFPSIKIFYCSRMSDTGTISLLSLPPEILGIICGHALVAKPDDIQPPSFPTRWSRSRKTPQSVSPPPAHI